MIVSFAAGIVLHRMLWKFFDWVLDAMERMDDEDYIDVLSKRSSSSNRQLPVACSVCFWSGLPALINCLQLCSQNMHN
jgi:hypothetical protein